MRTSNKSMLLDELVIGIREAFNRNEVFLDLDMYEEDPLLKQKDMIQKAILTATPEQLGKMQEMLQLGGIDNII
jgi:hypothetical protein